MWMHYALMGMKLDIDSGQILLFIYLFSLAYFSSTMFQPMVLFHSHKTLTIREKSFVKPFNQSLAVGSLLYSRNKVSAGHLAFLHNNTEEYEPEKMTASPITMSILPAK